MSPASTSPACSSSASVDHSPVKTQQSMSTVIEVVGHSGCRYVIQRVLQEKGSPSRKVYLASAGDQNFVLKDVSESNMEYYRNIYRDLDSCPYLRPLHDTISNPSMFVYNYSVGHLLGLAQKDLPIALTKRILKDTLYGLAELHDQNIVHTDVKPNNIMIDWEEDSKGISISRVQLSDLEDAARLPPGFNVRNLQVGNWMWRSPEAYTGGRLNSPSDMFSFGVVCIYAVTKKVIFYVGEDELGDGEEIVAHVLERHISCFADADGLDAFLKHISDSPYREIFEILRDGFDETNPREPFALMRGIDEDFKDLIGGLTNFDPAKRLTAHEALAHRWFEDI